MQHTRDRRWPLGGKVYGPERAKRPTRSGPCGSPALGSLRSDWFVAPPTPLEGIYAAVTRRTLDDRNPNGGFRAEIEVEDALRASQSGGAFASFEENDKGSLAAGKLADIVIIDRDLLKIRPESIRDAQIAVTIVGAGNTREVTTTRTTY